MNAVLDKAIDGFKIWIQSYKRDPAGFSTRVLAQRGLAGAWNTLINIGTIVFRAMTTEAYERRL